MADPTDDLDPFPDGAVDPDDGETHRGAFGEFGGEATGLIDRAFRERIVLAGVTLERADPEATDASMDELARLVDTAGADPVARVLQRREAPDRATYVGRGKAQEILTVSEAVDADTVVFDNDLTPAQQGNLEAILKRTALDRTAVILDIFAQNASSPEGKAQVELAQLRYRLPRLRHSGRSFSQQAGGIGTRGPGETQLEVDRRRLMRRVTRLESDLGRIRKNRSTQSKARHRTSNRAVAIVGYTNAGKSTLLNRLTDAGILVEDRLFATLDATTRRLQLPGGEAVFLSDTGELEPPRRGVERGEQPVLDQNPGIGQAVQERGLPGIGVANDGNRPVTSPVAGLGLGRPVLADASEVGLQTGDPAHEPTAIHLQLRLPGSPGPDAAGLLAENTPRVAEPREPVPKLSQLDLGLALRAAGVLGEDVKDHRRAIQRRSLQDRLEVSLLCRGEVVIKDHGVGVHGL